MPHDAGQSVSGGSTQLSGRYDGVAADRMASPQKVVWISRCPQLKSPGILEAATYLGQNYLVVDRSVCHAVLSALRQQHGYASITDLTAVHYPKDPLPFEIVWILYSMPNEARVRVKARRFAPCA